MADRRFHWWQAIAAMLGALATLATAVVAMAAYLRDDGSPPPATRPAGGSTHGAASAPPEESVAVPAPDQPLHDKLRLRLEFHIEFDTDPPNNNPVGGDPDLYRAGGADSNKITGYYGAARWSDATSPTQAQCDLELATKATRDSVVVDVGSRLCVRTSGGRTVLVRFLKQTADRDWDIEATVWPA